VADLEAGGVLALLDRTRLYPTMPTAVAAYHAETDPPRDAAG
jgi:hypothetical protein